ncbi:MAG: thioredoxin [Actinobacteria bacterium]|nr:thioredoxin [Actinomycetota bacterium]MCB9412106.1 thioredoxin [Actinomycetota bacterium]
MATVEVTLDNFKDTVETNDTVFIDFWAEWCGPCRMFGPVYEQVSEDNPDLVFAKVDTEAQQQLAAEFRITSIPTLMAIRDGIVIYSQPGALPKNNLEELVKAVRDVNMDEVRADIAKQQAEAAAEK